MPALKVFAVAGGTGASPIPIGPFIVEALLKTGVTVKVLARPGSHATPGAGKLKALGATIVEVNYEDPSSLETALEGVDVVISTVGGRGLGSQLSLAEAAAKSGVKLFVPSEFGDPSVHPDGTDRDVTTMGPMAVKVKVHQVLRDLKLPYVLVFTGVFADAVKWFWVTGEKKATIVGDGKQDVSWTTRGDIAEFVAKALTTIPLARLSNSTLRIEGSRIALGELFSKAGYEITSVTTGDSYKSWETNSDVVAWLKGQVSEGWGLTSPEPEKLDNALVPGWKPKHVLEFL